MAKNEMNKGQKTWDTKKKKHKKTQKKQEHHKHKHKKTCTCNVNSHKNWEWYPVLRMGKHNFIAGPALYMAPVTLQVSQSRVKAGNVKSGET